MIKKSGNPKFAFIELMRDKNVPCEAILLKQLLHWCIGGDETDERLGRFGHLHQKTRQAAHTRVVEAVRGVTLMEIGKRELFIKTLLKSGFAAKHVSAHGDMMDDRNVIKLKDKTEWALEAGTLNRSSWKVLFSDIGKHVAKAGHNLGQTTLTLLACNAGRKERNHDVLEFIASQTGFGAVVGWDGYSYLTESLLFFADFYTSLLWSYASLKQGIEPIERTVRSFCYAYSVLEHRYDRDKKLFGPLFSNMTKDCNHGFFWKVPQREKDLHAFWPRMVVQRNVLTEKAMERVKDLFASSGSCSKSMRILHD